MARHGKKHLPKSRIKKEVEIFGVRVNHKEIKIIGLVSEEIQGNSNPMKLNPYVALKYFKSEWQCFSDWNSQELKAFSSFLKVLQQHNWEQVYNTGSRIPKHGLAYTKYEVKDVKSSAIKNKLALVKEEISEDINFFELRVNQNKLRVHGFQSQAVFFLVALDKGHEAFPM